MLPIEVNHGNKDKENKTSSSLRQMPCLLNPGYKGRKAKRGVKIISSRNRELSALTKLNGLEEN